MCPEEEMKIILILPICSQMRLKRTRESECGVQSQPLRVYVGTSRLLPQLRSPQVHAEDWCFSLPLRTVNPGQFSFGLPSTQASYLQKQTYTFYTGTTWNKLEPFLPLSPGECGLVPWPNISACFVYKYLRRTINRGAPQRQAVPTPRKKSGNPASLAVLSSCSDWSVCWLNS